jgi:hypothetical protein
MASVHFLFYELQRQTLPAGIAPGPASSSLRVPMETSGHQQGVGIPASQEQNARGNQHPTQLQRTEISQVDQYRLELGEERAGHERQWS